jgi:hypothetical protein
MSIFGLQLLLEFPLENREIPYSESLTADREETVLSTVKFEESTAV